MGVILKCREQCAHVSKPLSARLRGAGRRHPCSGKAHQGGHLALTPAHLLHLHILCAQIGAQEEAAGAKPGSVSNTGVPKRQTITARMLPVCVLILATNVYALT